MEAAKKAVSDLTGRNVAEELLFVREVWATPFDRRLVLSLERTGEVFHVRTRDSRVVLWEFGSYRLSVGGGITPTEAFERAVIAAYYRGPDVSRMVKVSSIRTGGSWNERLENGVLNDTNRCRVRWEGKPPRPLAFITLSEPLRIDSEPRLTYQEAIQRAITAVTAWPGVDRAQEGPEILWRDAPFRGAASVESDDAGLQRLIYVVCLRVEWQEGPSDPQPKAIVGPDPRPTTIDGLVDAHTGDFFFPHSGSVWPPGVARDRLETGVSGRPLTLLFQSRFVDQRVYICARYLDSLIWQGAYARSEAGNDFEIGHQGRKWLGSVGESVLRSEGTAVAFSGPAMEIEGEVYLPQDVIQRLTGWDIRLRQDALLGRMVEISGPQAPD
jgi:hypothetical protein